MKRGDDLQLETTGAALVEMLLHRQGPLQGKLSIEMGVEHGPGGTAYSQRAAFLRHADPTRWIQERIPSPAPAWVHRRHLPASGPVIVDERNGREPDRIHWCNRRLRSFSHLLSYSS